MTTTSRGSGRIGLIGAVLCLAITFAFAIGAFWQHGESVSKKDDAEQYQRSAGLFRQAEAEGQAAGTALQEYVATGDATLIQQVNEHTSSGVTLLTAAVEESGVDAQQLLDGGSALVQAEGQIIALRQSGDVEGAVAGLTQLQTQFEDFLAIQTGIIESQDAAAQSARDDADAADNLSTVLGVGAMVFALGSLAGGAYYIRQSASRRRSVGTVPST